MVRALDLHYNGIGWQIVRKSFAKNCPKDSELYEAFSSELVKYKCFIKMKFEGLYRDVRVIITKF